MPEAEARAAARRRAGRAGRGGDASSTAPMRSASPTMAAARRAERGPPAAAGDLPAGTGRAVRARPGRRGPAGQLGRRRAVGAAKGYATGRSFAALVEPPSRAAVRSQLAAAVRTGEPRVLTCGLYGPAGVQQCEVMIRTVSVRGEDDRLLGDRLPHIIQGEKGRGAVSQIRGWSRLRTAIVASTARIDVVTAINKLLLENVVSSEGQLLQRFGRLLADRLASWAIIDMCWATRCSGTASPGPTGRTRRGRAQTAMAVHADAGVRPRPGGQAGSPMLVAHPDDEDILGVDRRTACRCSCCSAAPRVLCAPIAADGISYGTLTLVRSAGGRHLRPGRHGAGRRRGRTAGQDHRRAADDAAANRGRRGAAGQPAADGC